MITVSRQLSKHACLTSSQMLWSQGSECITRAALVKRCLHYKQGEIMRDLQKHLHKHGLFKVQLNIVVFRDQIVGRTRARWRDKLCCRVALNVG